MEYFKRVQREHKRKENSLSMALNVDFKTSAMLQQIIMIITTGEWNVFARFRV